MNEDILVDSKYRSATLKEAISALNKRELIEEINRLATQKNCNINICHHTDEQKKDEIHFILEPTVVGGQTIATDIDASKISAFVSDSIAYDSVLVDFKDEYTLPNFKRLFEGITPFTPENYDNIQIFLKRYYSQYYQDVSTVHQDKRQRSVSPPPSSLFTQNGNHQQSAVNLPTPEIVAEYLQKAPWWPALSTSPERAGEVIDKGCGLAKRTISKKQSSDLRPTGAAK